MNIQCGKVYEISKEYGQEYFKRNWTFFAKHVADYVIIIWKKEIEYLCRNVTNKQTL